MLSHWNSCSLHSRGVHVVYRISLLDLELARVSIAVSWLSQWF